LGWWKKYAKDYLALGLGYEELWLKRKISKKENDGRNNNHIRL
jgi:hypothetical protein